VGEVDGAAGWIFLNGKSGVGKWLACGEVGRRCGDADEVGCAAAYYLTFAVWLEEDGAALFDAEAVDCLLRVLRMNLGEEG